MSTTLEDFTEAGVISVYSAFHSIVVLILHEIGKYHHSMTDQDWNFPSAFCAFLNMSGSFFGHPRFHSASDLHHLELPRKIPAPSNYADWHSSCIKRCTYYGEFQSLNASSGVGIFLAYFVFHRVWNWQLTSVNSKTYMMIGKMRCLRDATLLTTKQHFQTHKLFPSTSLCLGQSWG